MAPPARSADIAQQSVARGVDKLPEVIADLRQRLECLELAECHGRCVSIDTTAKTAVVAFDAAWKLTSPLYKAFDVPPNLTGCLGVRKRWDAGKRLRFGDYWITPIVKARQAVPFSMARCGDISYVACGDIAGTEKQAAEFYLEHLSRSPEHAN
jgi:hypothetical protein